MTDSPSDAPPEPSEPSEPPAPPAPRPGRARTFALVGAVVIALVAIAGLVTQTARLQDKDDEIATREEVAAAAGALAEAILTYDYNDVDGSLARVEEHIGGDFAEIYAETFRTAQVPVIVQLQAVAEAVVQQVYVTDVDGDTAHAIALVDQTVQSTAGVRTLSGTYLQMDLVDRDGRWIVESIPLRISSRNETLTPVPGADDPAAASTTTTTPSG